MLASLWGEDNPHSPLVRIQTITATQEVTMRILKKSNPVIQLCHPLAYDIKITFGR